MFLRMVRVYVQQEKKKDQMVNAILNHVQAAPLATKIGLVISTIKDVDTDVQKMV